jgi:hypothetical protein
MITPNNVVQRVFIHCVSVDIIYARRIQYVLEKQGFITSILRLAQSEHVDGTDFRSGLSMQMQSLLSEVNSSIVDAHLVISTCGFDMDHYMRATVSLMEGSEKFILLDISSCLMLPPEKLTECLTQILEQQLSYRFDGTLDPNRHLIRYLDSLDVRHYKRASELLTMLHKLDDATLLTEFYESRGILTKAMLHGIRAEGLRSSQPGRLNSLSYKYTSYGPEPAREALFISYSNRDLGVVRLLQIALEEQNIRTYIFELGYLREIANNENAKQALMRNSLWQHKVADIVNSIGSWLGILPSDYVSVMRDLGLSKYIFQAIEGEIDAPIVDYILALDSPDSRASIWTLLEQEYARLVGKPIKRIDISTVNADDSAAIMEISDQLQSTQPKIEIPLSDLTTETLHFVFVAELYEQDKLEAHRFADLDRKSGGQMQKALTFYKSHIRS